MPTAIYQAQTADARQILLAMGMGQFNATMVIPYLFIAPATTDADMAQVQMLVSLIQRRLNSLGASVSVTGRLDPQTTIVLQKMLGPNWVRMSWYEICRALIARSDIYATAAAPSRGRAQALSGFGDGGDGLGVDLPDLPGGHMTYFLLGGLALWYFNKRRGKTA